jgi:hypothetical protein
MVALESGQTSSNRGVVIAITAVHRSLGYDAIRHFNWRHMTNNFDTNARTGEYKRPLLDASEELLARELQRDADFSVDSLDKSLLARFLSFIAPKR